MDENTHTGRAMSEPLSKTIPVRVTPDEAQAVALLAAEDQRSVSAYVRRLIRLALDEATAREREQ